MILDYYFTKAIMSKHQWQELFCVYIFVINKFTTYTRYWDDRSGPAEQFWSAGTCDHLFWTCRPGLLLYQNYFTIIVTDSKCICYVSKANLSVLSLWLFRFVRLLKLNLQPLTRIFLLFCLMAHAGFTSRGLQIMIFRVSVIPSFCLECRLNM